MLRVEFKTPASNYGGIFEGNIRQVYLSFIVTRSKSRMISGFYNFYYLFMRITSTLVVLHYTLHHEYYRLQSIYGHENTMNSFILEDLRNI